MHPHPIGIAFWRNGWNAMRNVPYSQVHSQFQSWYGLTMHRNFGAYFHAHRAGKLGVFGPLLVGFAGIKVGCMYYGSQRDTKAAIAAAGAYGQSGYRCNPVPK